MYSPDDRSSFFCFGPDSHPVDVVNMDGRRGMVDVRDGEALSLAMTLRWAPLTGARNQPQDPSGSG